MNVSPPTNTEAGGPDEWLIADAVTHLRGWSTSVSCALPPPSLGGTIGAAEECWLQLHDPAGRVSRQHARLVYEPEKPGVNRWKVDDLNSKNGLTLDGARRLSFPLTPGIEIGLGGHTLVAESPLLVGLREVFARLIGWADDRRADLDLALRAARFAATRREALQLCGEGELIPIALLLHRRTLGDARPFVVCDPRPSRTDPSHRQIAYYTSGMDALAAARGGTLCVWHSRLPPDFAQVVEARRKLAARVQLIVCRHTIKVTDAVVGSPIVLPPLEERTGEIGRIIDAYACDAGAAPGRTLTAADRVWIETHEAETLAQIERATRRLVAIRSTGSITRAAAELGMAHGSLSEWIARRTLDIEEEEQHS
jgi:FHA domain